MYQSYFGLAEAPFSISPDPRYLYLSQRHQDDFLQILVRALRQKDPRWGFNWVRGVGGDSHGDVFAGRSRLDLSLIHI